MVDEVLYARPYTSENQRREALQVWVNHYNYHRPHTSCGDAPPATLVPVRVNNVMPSYIYTPLHREIELYRPTPVVRDPSSIGKRRRYTPQEAGYELDVSTDTAVAWANDFQHASAADGLIVGGDWNALSERALQDRRPDIERSGRDATGRAWRQLLQERPDPVPTYSYGDRVNRGFRFIDQVYTRLPEGLDARLEVIPPPAIDKSAVRMGFASDHAQLRVEVAATRTHPNFGTTVQMAGACA